MTPPFHKCRYAHQAQKHLPPSLAPSLPLESHGSKHCLLSPSRVLTAACINARYSDTTTATTTTNTTTTSAVYAYTSAAVSANNGSQRTAPSTLNCGEPICHCIAR